MIIELDEYTTLLLLMMALSSNSTLLDGCTESLEMIMWSENKIKQSKTMMQQILERHLYLERRFVKTYSLIHPLLWEINW